MKEVQRDVTFSISLDPQHPISGVPFTHRPLTKYFESLRSAGFCVRRFRELFPNSDVMQLYGSPWKTPRYVLFEADLHRGTSDGHKQRLPGTQP